MRDTDALGDKPKRADRRPLAADEEDGPVDEWGVLDVRPSHDDDGIPVAGRSGREKPSKLASLDVSVGDAAPSRVSVRPKPVKEKPSGRPRRSFGRRLFISLVVILLLAAAGWGLFASGLIALVEPGRPTRTVEPKSAAVPAEQGARVQPDTPTQQGALTLPPPASGALTPPPPASGIALPDTVVTLPAVVALSRSDPAAFERFKRRFADAAVNAKDDEVLSVARAALRKSVKRLLANAPGDTLLEITEAYLAYMQGLQSTSPESCVALSDESKGAKLTSNLAKQFPIQFIRDMSVLERVASISPNTTVAPLTADEARPFLETVFNNLRQQPVKSELLGRDKLNPTDFQPYCTLVIAFYQAVLELPRDDKVKLLRYLYASAATDPDSDLK